MYARAPRSVSKNPQQQRGNINEEGREDKVGVGDGKIYNGEREGWGKKGKGVYYLQLLSGRFYFKLIFPTAYSTPYTVM